MPKIYTQTGDNGETSLVGGIRVPKTHPRIEASGVVDELIAHIGLIRSFDINDDYKTELIAIQDKLMCCCSIISSDWENNYFKLPQVTSEDIKSIELQIDKKKNFAPGFTLSGGSIVTAHIDIARTICRRAEREVIKCNYSDKINDLVLIYINRISDYLYVLGRCVSCELNVNEIYWNPKY